MSYRFVGSFGALAVVVGMAVLEPESVAAQATADKSKAGTSSATKPWTPPVTVFGQPDLQGVWLNNSATPWNDRRWWLETRL